MRRSVVLAAFVASLCQTSLASAEVVWRGDFETGDISQWTRAQAVSADRLQIVTDPVAQGRYAVKATVVAGDNPIGASGNRNELVRLTYEPKGSEYWYRWRTMFDETYPSADTWQLFTQWHHSGSSGSPPVEFIVRAENLILSIGDANFTIAPLVRGKWHDFVFHAKWSSDPSEGFVELYYDGEIAVSKRMIANQFSGMTNYLKQGLYRNDTITQTGIVYHDGFVMGTTLADVWPSFPEPACVEGAVDACPGDGTAGVGICRAGVRTCVGQAWSQCSGEVLPQSEACDGLDNDCDGQLDEGCASDCAAGETRTCFAGSPSSLGRGACLPGVQTCSPTGTWGACEGGRGPEAEVCGDTVDNDCNGAVDETCPGPGSSGEQLVEPGDAPGAGCSAAGGGLQLGAAVLGLALLWRRRR